MSSLDKQKHVKYDNLEPTYLHKSVFFFARLKFDNLLFKNGVWDGQVPLLKLQFPHKCAGDDHQFSSYGEKVTHIVAETCYF